MGVIVRKDPPESEAQRRAMWAAKSGHSTLGIPKSVGAEFAKSDPGGKLPEKKHDAAVTSSVPMGPAEPAAFDRHDIKGYMDSVRRGDANSMKERADKWRK